MGTIFWNQTYSVNISSIDKQHQKLISLINQFYDSITQKSNREKLESLIDGLQKYAIYHFSHEEELMTKYGYSNLEEHKKEHAEFISKVENLIQRMKENRMVLPVEVTNFVKDWLLKHIMGTDKDYSDFLVSKGAT